MKKLLAALLLTVAPVLAMAHEGHDADMQKKWQASLSMPQLAVGAAFDEQGRLWRAEIREGHVYVSRSADGGQTFGPAVAVNPEAENVAGDGENRPKIAVRGGVVYIAYTQALDQPMTGNIRFSRSLDGGKTFSPPLTVNDDRQVISHRFEAMGVNGRGQVFLAWLDKRDLNDAKSRGVKYSGAAVYYAVSDDKGASFHPNVKVADHSCECCRVALALDWDGVPVAFWRHVFDGNVRDHALAKLDGKSAPVRVSRDNWQVDACPHHGPAISIDPDGTYHLVWFNNGAKGPGLFYARSQDGGKSFSAPLAFGNGDAQAAHPYVLGTSAGVFVAWKEFDGQHSQVMLMRSTDGGAHWSAPAAAAMTADNSDHPLLLASGARVFLAWNTKAEGFRLISVSEGDQL